MSEIPIDIFIERKIVIGLITSDDYCRLVVKIWNPAFIESSSARLLCNWAIGYFNKYDKAPNTDIKGIFQGRVDAGLDKERASDIADILEGLSEDADSNIISNVSYLWDSTEKYFKRRNIKLLQDKVSGLLANDEVTEAEATICGYSTLKRDKSSATDPFNMEESELDTLFAESDKPLFKVPGAWGHFMNEQFTPDSFIAFMGPDKSGKTFLLMELAFRALMAGKTVAFFQAGDMTEKQQIRRFCIYLGKKSDSQKYCNGNYIPEVDCLYNQNDTCKREEREDDQTPVCAKDFRGNWTYDALKEAFEEYPEHRPCRNCSKLRGVPWFTYMNPTEPLTSKEAYKALKQFKDNFKTKFKLSSHSNESLSVRDINNYLTIWEKEEDFIPEVIVVDYADILDGDPDMKNMDERGKTNKVWQRLRRLSQDRRVCLITGTQAAATAYDKPLIGRKDFSEDKRKLAHVTAMYGLNNNDEESKIGMQRINEIVKREGEMANTNQVTIFRRLQIGKPYLGSFI